MNINYKMLYIQLHELYNVVSEDNQCLQGLINFIEETLDEAEQSGKFKHPISTEDDGVRFIICKECNIEYPAEWKQCPFCKE
ncbi:hypothetical protein [Clostridium sp.]|uniref:hypothetical protein n=1 Tax=Clostridium sp. TaxID=1506 RepID=UPI003217823F